MAGFAPPSNSGIPTWDELRRAGEEHFPEALADPVADGDTGGNEKSSDAVAADPAHFGVPATGHPGDVVTATVGGFADGETVSVSFAGNPVADIANGGSAIFTLPSVEVDTTFEVGAYGNSSEVYAVASVTVIAPDVEQTGGDTGDGDPNAGADEADGAVGGTDSNADTGGELKDTEDGTGETEGGAADEQG